MINVEDMKEVQKGIFIPDGEFVMTDDWQWCVNNRGYSCIVDAETRKILIAYRKGIDGIAYAYANFNANISVIGGLPDASGVQLGGLSL